MSNSLHSYPPRTVHTAAWSDSIRAADRQALPAAGPGDLSPNTKTEISLASGIARLSDQAVNPIDMLDQLKQMINHTVHSRLEVLLSLAVTNMYPNDWHWIEESIRREYTAVIQQASQIIHSQLRESEQNSVWRTLWHYQTEIRAYLDQLLLERSQSWKNRQPSVENRGAESLLSAENLRLKFRRAPSTKDPLPKGSLGSALSLNRQRRALPGEKSALLEDPGSAGRDVQSYQAVFSALRRKHGHTPYWEKIAEEAQKNPQHISYLSDLLKTFVKTQKGNQSLTRGLYALQSTVRGVPYQPKVSDYLTVQFVLDNKLTPANAVDNPYNTELIEALKTLSLKFREAEKSYQSTQKEAHALSGSPFQALCFEALRRALPDRNALQPMADVMAEIDRNKVQLTAETVGALVEAKPYLFAILSFWLRAENQRVADTILGDAEISEQFKHAYSAEGIRMLTLAILRIGAPSVQQTGLLEQNPAEKMLVRWLAELDDVERDRRWLQFMSDPYKKYLVPSRFTASESLNAQTRRAPEFALAWALNLIPAELKSSFQTAYYELNKKGVLNSTTLGLIVAYPTLAVAIAAAMPVEPEKQNLDKLYLFCNDIARLKQNAGGQYQLALRLNIPISRLMGPEFKTSYYFEQARALLGGANYSISQLLDQELKNAGKYAVEFAQAIIAVGKKNYQTAEQEKRWPEVLAAFIRYVLTQPAYRDLPWGDVEGATLNVLEVQFRSALENALKENRGRKAQMIGRMIGLYLQEKDSLKKQKRWLALMSTDAVAPLFPDPEPRVKSIVKGRHSLDETVLRLIPSASQASVRDALIALKERGKMSDKARSILVALPEFTPWLLAKLTTYPADFVDTLSLNVVFGLKNGRSLKELADFLKIPETEPAYQQLKSAIEADARAVLDLVRPLHQQFIQKPQRPVAPNEIDTLTDRLSSALTMGTYGRSPSSQTLTNLAEPSARPWANPQLQSSRRYASANDLSRPSVNRPTRPKL